MGMLQVKEVKKRNVQPNEGSLTLRAHFALVRQAGKRGIKDMEEAVPQPEQVCAWLQRGGQDVLRLQLGAAPQNMVLKGSCIETTILNEKPA